MARMTSYYGRAATIKTEALKISVDVGARYDLKRCVMNAPLARELKMGQEDFAWRGPCLEATADFLLYQMPAKKFHRFGPCQSRGMGPVVGGTCIGKGVSGARIGVKLVRLIPACEFGIELAHILG
jgi:hypothetical protein